MKSRQDRCVTRGGTTDSDPPFFIVCPHPRMNPKIFLHPSNDAVDDVYCKSSGYFEVTETESMNWENCFLSCPISINLCNNSHVLTNCFTHRQETRTCKTGESCAISTTFACQFFYGCSRHRSWQDINWYCMYFTNLSFSRNWIDLRAICRQGLLWMCETFDSLMLWYCFSNKILYEYLIRSVSPRILMLCQK